MIEIQIDDRVKKVSTEMTIRQYKKYFNNKTKYEGNPLMMLSLLVDEPVDVLRDLPKNQVDFVLNYLSDEITKNPMGDLVMTFEHDGIKYGLENDWSNLAWGAWVDLEILSSEDIDNNIDHILAVMYRPVLTNKGTDYTIESYKSKSVLTRKKIFEDLPVKYWFNFAGFFFSNRQNIHLRYQQFFEIDQQDESTDSKDTQETPEIPKRESVSRFYFSLTFNLANDDLTKIQQIEEMNVYLVLNAASFLKDRRIKEENELKKLRNQKIS